MEGGECVVNALSANGRADMELSSGEFQHEDIKQKNFDGEYFTE